MNNSYPQDMFTLYNIFSCVGCARNGVGCGRCGPDCKVCLVEKNLCLDNKFIGCAYEESSKFRVSSKKSFLRLV